MCKGKENARRIPFFNVEKNGLQLGSCCCCIIVNLEFFLIGYMVCSLFSAHLGMMMGIICLLTVKNPGCERRRGKQ